jgi:hypothetical protein
MREYGGVDVQIRIFLTSTLVGGEWSASRPSHFTPGERAPGTHLVGGWVGLRTDLDDVEKRKFLTLSSQFVRVSSLHIHFSPPQFYRNDYVSAGAHLSEGTFRFDIQTRCLEKTLNS